MFSVHLCLFLCCANTITKNHLYTHTHNTCVCYSKPLVCRFILSFFYSFPYLPKGSTESSGGISPSKQPPVRSPFMCSARVRPAPPALVIFRLAHTHKAQRPHRMCTHTSSIPTGFFSDPHTLVHHTDTQEHT
uniref:Secreted protein n=1 Tax=Schizaphis graminum TaxID=13262 RepID=A0A2S2NSF8_SCHGA